MGSDQRAARGVGALCAAAALVVMVLLATGLGASAASNLDGTYTGTYSGSASGNVEFSIADSQVTVRQPGSGSGTVSGSDINMVVGNATVSGYSCEYSSSGQVSVASSGEGVASGTWSATCNGANGNGTWEARRPAPSPSVSSSPTPSPSVTAQPSPRSLSLKAKPKTLHKPGRTTLTATLSDCSAQSSVDFQLRGKDGFRTIASVGTDADCTASTARRVASRTAFRAQAPAETEFLGATSRVVTVRIDRK